MRIDTVVVTRIILGKLERIGGHVERIKHKSKSTTSAIIDSALVIINMIRRSL